MSEAKLFDALTAWRRMPLEMQERIGVAAIVHTLGAMGAEAPLEPGDVDLEEGEVGLVAAEFEGMRALEAAVSDAVPEAIYPVLRRPDLEAIGVRVCSSCGCTDAVGCPEGCSWVGPALCSSCSGKG